MARSLTRTQILENRAFLKALALTGNVRLAAREVGVAYGTIQHRRAQHFTFAQEWDVALAVAAARLNATLDPAAPAAARVPEGEGGAHRTEGGEPVIVRTPDGRVQVRRAQPGKLTRACEQAFLSALSVTANVSLSAAAAGAAEGAFYRRRRNNPAFAREMQAALATGFARVEATLLGSLLPTSHEDDAWRHHPAPAMPAVSTAQALQLLYLHQKEVRLTAVRRDLRRGAGEGSEDHSARLATLYIAGLAQAAEDELLRTVLRNVAVTAMRHDPPPAVPPLDGVEGWSRADPEGVPHHPDVALFGGWRLGDL